MKKIFSTIYTLFILISSSCNTDCNDCGKYTSTSYSVKNESGNDISMLFYKDGTMAESVVKDNEIKELYQISVTSQGGFLSAEPFSYDSVHFIVNDIIDEIFFKNDCNLQSNPLCEKNYSLVKNEKDSDGNTFIDYEITILK